MQSLLRKRRSCMQFWLEEPEDPCAMASACQPIPIISVSAATMPIRRILPFIRTSVPLRSKSCAMLVYSRIRVKRCRSPGSAQPAQDGVSGPLGLHLPRGLVPCRDRAPVGGPFHRSIAQLSRIHDILMS